MLLADMYLLDFARNVVSCTYQLHKFCDICRSCVHLIPLKINQNKLVVIFFLLTDFLILYTYNTDYLICAVFRA